MEKTLDVKLADIHRNPDSKAFILADAKDADMAYGIAAPGRARTKSPERPDGEFEFRSLEQYREHIRQNVRQGLIDIMLMSVSTNEALAIKERLFNGSAVTPAVRANDTTDIHLARGGDYSRQPAQPFRTALLEHAQCGKVQCEDCARRCGANLGLYSLTFNNDVELDARTLQAYKEFRVEAERKGFRHFLEVFDPNAPVHPIPPEALGGFINDQIVRALAGVASPGRPIFLKIVYHGPRFMEELARYDRHLVPGILGGGAGTTHDAFKLLAEAKKYGAKAALYGRKINTAEHQPSFIQFLRWIADGQVPPQEAVRAYHGVLAGLGLRPHRPLEDDLRLTDPTLTAPAAGGRTVSIPPAAAAPSGVEGPAHVRPGATGAARAARTDQPAPAPAYPHRGDDPWPTKPNGLPDFARMTSRQRLAYHQGRLDKSIEGKESTGPGA